MRLLLRAQVRVLLRDRQSLFWAIVFPLIFLAVFRLFSFDAFGETELALGGETETRVGAALADGLAALDFVDLEVAPGLDEAGALARIDADEIGAALIVGPAAADGTQAVELLHGLRDPLAASPLEAAIASVVDGVNVQMTGAPELLQFSARAAGEEGTSFFEFVAPGIIGMGLMTFSTISLAASLARYREEGVTRRLRATPLRPWRFFAAVVGSYLLVAFVQVVVLLLFAQLLGVSLLGSTLPFLVLALLGNLVFLELGVVVTGLVHGRYAVEGAANAVTMPMMFLSGTFFPTDALPRPVELAVEALPLTHLLRALRDVSLDGESLWAQGPEVAVLLGWVAGTFLVARRVFRLDDA